MNLLLHVLAGWFVVAALALILVAIVWVLLFPIVEGIREASKQTQAKSTPKDQDKAA